MQEHCVDRFSTNGSLADHPDPSYKSDEYDRVIVHIDVDAFYAQVEELKQPALALRPLGITQKHIVVTCNYPARARGVQKLMTIKDALHRCPELVTIKGEDLTPYRAANKALLAVLRRYGTVRRGGLDEALVDVTHQVTERLQSSHWSVLGEWKGKVYGQGASNMEPSSLLVSKPYAWWGARLQCGTVLADEMRRVIRVETGLRSSAGIACNPLLAKLASSVHKPDDQTVVLPPDALAFVANLSVSAIPGVGSRLESILRNQFGVTHVHQLRSIDVKRLEREVGNRQATMLVAACWGRDPLPVTESLLPKTIGVEDSFPKTLNNSKLITTKLRSLSSDLMDRVRAEEEEHQRLPTRLVLTWRVAGDGWKRRSASCESGFNNIDELVNLATRLLRNSVHQEQLTLLALCATQFVPAHAQSGQRRVSTPSITNFLTALPVRSTETHDEDDNNNNNNMNMNSNSSSNCTTRVRRHSGQRETVIHCDVDCFYCAVERLDDPLCRGRPIAVSQFHGGGFVSVSYEAREAGIRCGDGAGSGGRAGVQHLKDMGARSVRACLAACPELVVKPMRPERYRQMSDSILDLFRSVLQSARDIEEYAIEKASCDDFYIKIVANTRTIDDEDVPMTVVPASGHPQCFHSNDADVGLTMDLKHGAVVANKLKSALKQRYGMVASCGVARNKLLARLASPCGKPDGLVVVSDAGVLDFVGNIAITKVPGLQGSFGRAVAKDFSRVADLRGCSCAQLIRNYGHIKGKFLADLAYGLDDRNVVDHDGNASMSKSISTERSFEPRGLDDSAELTALLEALSKGLLQRVSGNTLRKVDSLTVGGRNGSYDVNKSCKGKVPEQVIAWCTALPNKFKSAGIDIASRALAHEVLSRLRQLFGSHEKVSRVSCTLHFCSIDVSEVSVGIGGQLHVVNAKPGATTPGTSKAATTTVVSYRNKHADDVERLFSTSDGGCGRDAFAFSRFEDPDEALAYRLQKEEVELARIPVVATTAGKKRKSSALQKSNVLDSFVIKGKDTVRSDEQK